jgi:hypothetical protein
VLRSWGILCDKPKALASGRVDWADQRIDLSSMTRAPAEGALSIGQGELMERSSASFANGPLSRAGRGGDPTLEGAIFALEHSTGKQRKWQLQNANYVTGVNEEFLWFGTGFFANSLGCLLCRYAPEFAMRDADVGFINVQPAVHL